MSDRYYILKGKKTVPCAGLMEWAHWFQANDRHVAQDYIGPARISTIFLGIDHGFGWLTPEHSAPPLLFETMIFGGEHDGYQERCSTWEEAEAQHAEARRLVKASIQ